MAFKMKYKNLEEVIAGLKKASKTHAKQAEIVEDHLDKLKNSPLHKSVPNCVPRGKGEKRLSKEANDPCWPEYTQRGMKNR